MPWLSRFTFFFFFFFPKHNVKGFTILFLLSILKEEGVGNLLMAAGFQAQADCEDDVCVG